MDEIYNIFWSMNKLTLLCASVDSHTNKMYSSFHTLNFFNIIRQQSGEMVKKYFDIFKVARVNLELS